MADADAASVRLSSDSKADLSDPEKPGDDAASLSADAEDGRPWWKRVLVSGADGAHTTQRGMRSRHLMMIAIGGTIGTGIFLSAGSVSTARAPPAFHLSTSSRPMP
ncbi:hypothetical protein POSPLADRAFT_1035841 [Postia placenta MAD-698-R-SB12]|uniref:Amino acid permease/ SLC12A domain-containing protein n=1 Tax=Postia placenta MAD-698-R-SB12 TaxID=670580 RepID=A0A1X6MTA8_9APHY|nr:hypothetical protein POSPLADRAFT_1035841 [Postia placenta MAD-698-R-SB12]OSX59624.1 hypothetical protein POSPLADRAFT_1035841 [Postia placenta MAD-698-R-SB12]